jgi:predicted helicase
VSINIFVKTGRKPEGTPAEVYHCELYGRRSEKYKYLQNKRLQSVKWKKLKLSAPCYFFVPKNFGLKKEYERGFVINELFNTNVTGIVTARDSLVIDADKKVLRDRIRRFCDIRISDDEVRVWLFPNKSDKKYLPGDSRGWKLSEARVKIRNNNHDELIVDIKYRPFDTRKIYYTPVMVDWGREKIMRHFLIGENVGLIFKRGFAENATPVFVSNRITDFRLWSRPGMQGGDYIAPLYLSPDSDGLEESANRTPNLDMKIVESFAESIKLEFESEKTGNAKKFAPIDILDYIYAVLHSPKYRERYKEFLKIDFPRVPYPKDAKSFRKLTKLGEKLRRLHLLEDVEPKQRVADYGVSGNNVVDYIKYTDGNVWINETQFFDGVPSEVWDFYIGGYQPAQKWLKDRKGRQLTHDDIEHYQKIVFVLQETIKLIGEVDEAMA